MHLHSSQLASVSSLSLPISFPLLEALSKENAKRAHSCSEAYITGFLSRTVTLISFIVVSSIQEILHSIQHVKWWVIQKFGQVQRHEGLSEDPLELQSAISNSYRKWTTWRRRQPTNWVEFHLPSWSFILLNVTGSGTIIYFILFTYQQSFI